MIEEIFTKDDLIKYAAMLHKLREENQNCKTPLEHTIWSMYNFANFSICDYFHIDHNDLDRYMKQYDKQYELDFNKEEFNENPYNLYPMDSAEYPDKIN